MANTIIQIKKSGLAGNTPSSLNYGELALNYADGKLFYKNSGGSIVPFTSGSSTFSFSTINVASTLILASSSTDTLSFANGGGILFSGNTTSKTISQQVTGYQTFLAPFSGALTASQIGALVQIGGNVTIPNANSCPLGGTFTFTNQTSAAYTVTVTGGADFLYHNPLLTNTNKSVTINSGETLQIASRGPASTEWDCVGGTALTKYTAITTANTINTAILQTGTITAAGANTKGGTGYFDFLVANNQSGGATNTNKWFRLDSTGTLQIINSAYTTNIFNLTDAGALTATSFSGAGTGLTGTASSLTAGFVSNISGGAANQIHYQTGANTTSFITAPSNGTFLYYTTGGGFSWSAATSASVGTANVATYSTITNATTGIYYPTIVNATSGNLQEFANNAFAYDTANGRFGIGTTSPAYNLHVVGSFAATTKSFVIDHPTKKGKKLRYSSLEGPENGVYVRGRLTDDNVIHLPVYWIKLVDKNTITVNLTPIGNYQQLFVKQISGNSIIIDGSDEIDCFYTVFAERKDVEKLEVEVDV